MRALSVDMDPREALLRQANNQTPNKEVDYFTNVFKKTMPAPIYSKRTLEADKDHHEQTSAPESQSWTLRTTRFRLDFCHN